MCESLDRAVKRDENRIVYVREGNDQATEMWKSFKIKTVVLYGVVCQQKMNFLG